MPAKLKETRRRIIDAAYALFYKEGFAHVSVDAIAAAAGFTKRTLYYHFQSKDALVAEVLAAQHHLMLGQIAGWVSHASGDPETMVGIMFSEMGVWARKPGWRGSGFTRAAMEFARSPGHPARKAARRHKAEVEVLLAQQFADQGVAASASLVRQIVMLIEGCNVLMLIHGDPSYALEAEAAAKLLVRRHTADR
ncbi:MAG: helix-turn-helix domain-containing protein [Betaproteobacteria bacterium]